MENSLRTIIIDDDLVATEQLKAALSIYPMLKVCGNAYTGTNGRNLILDIVPDLIFLDMELPDCMGFDYLHSVRGLLKKECHVIFFTAYNKYLIKALREKAFDYLLKPIDSNELSIVIGRVLEDLHIQNTGTNTEKDNTSLILNTAKGDMLMVHSDDISFFSYDEKQRYWNAFLCNGERYALKRATKSDNLLSFSAHFKMTDRSHIINIRELSMIKNGLCIMKSPYNEMKDISISKANMLDLRKNYPNI